MRGLKKTALQVGMALLLLGSILSPASAEQPPQRIVSLGGDITEIVYALGLGEQVVAVDTTSRFPTQAQALPQLGYVRALSAEGVLAQRPDVVVAGYEAGPPPVIATLQGFNVPFVQTPKRHSLNGILEKIDIVARALGADRMAQQLKAQLAPHIAKLPITSPAPPSVLFILQAQGNSLMAAGSDTAADAVIALAGGRNPLKAQRGYRPINAELIASEDIDFVLVMQSSADRMGGIETLTSHPALQGRIASGATRIIIVDGIALLGFGPRTPQAILSLASQIGTR